MEQEILKHIANIEREFNSLKKLITAQEVPKTPTANSLDSELKATAVRVMEFLNEQYNTKFLTTSKGNITPIIARLKEGYTFDDCALVIQDRKEKWGKDQKMCEYLRPSTIFLPTNFQNYLNSAQRLKSDNRYGSYSAENVEEEMLRRLTDE